MNNEKTITPINEDLNVAKYETENITNLIYTIRGKQVMLDSDVAMLYHYETKGINKAMKRNIERFPEDFCFQLTESEFENLRFQIGTLNRNVNNGNVIRKYLPYVYSEQGISMLAGVLKNEIAVQISISIMRAFVEMRKIILNNAQIFQEINIIKGKMLEHDRDIHKLFTKFEENEQKQFKQQIFFEGQIWDSYSLIVDIIRKAKDKILIIDNYIDDSILKMLAKKKENVKVVILTSDKSNISKLDIQKFNKQYGELQLAKTDKFHDRFLIIDENLAYHIGASIKDAGKKCFGINRIEDEGTIKDILERVKLESE